MATLIRESTLERETLTRAEHIDEMNEYAERRARCVARQFAPDWVPTFSPWRHGGWYVDNLTYPSGAVGCVSRNYADKKWRIVCDPRPFDEQPTFANRDAAARGERELVAQLAAEG